MFTTRLQVLIFSNLPFLSLLDGCPLACNSHGNCVEVGGVYTCSCSSGWKGQACEAEMEVDCNDDTDNDNGK